MRTIWLVVLALAAAGASAQSTPSEKTYKPQGGVAAPAGKVRLAGVRLLSAQSEFESNVGVQSLAAYIRQVEKLAVESFASAKDGGVMVQFSSGPQRQEFKLASQGNLDQALLQQFHERLAKMERLQVRNNPVSFQVQFAITP